MRARFTTCLWAAPTALLCLGALALPSGSAGAAVQGTEAALPLTTAKVTRCQHGSTAAERVATFRAGMRQTAGSARLSMRFYLQESVVGGRYHSISAPGLGVWRKSRPGVGAFAYRQKVKALAEGSSYRVSVSYRWQDGKGTVVKTARRRSPACRQTGPLPNLRIQRIGGKPVDGAPARTRFAVTVINSGLAPSPASAVELMVDSAVAGRAMVPKLVPGQISRVFVEGADCVGGVSAEVDPDELVRESNELDNDRKAACPVP
jgi:CARDB